MVCHKKSGEGPRRVPHVCVGGVDVASVGESEIIAAMVEDCTGEHPAGSAVTVLDCNGQALSLAVTDPSFSNALDKADLIHADGQFIVWSSWLSKGTRVPERTATTDFIHAAAMVAARKGLSFYLLGGAEEVNKACAEVLARDYPGLRIAGRRNGFFDEAQTDEVIAKINQSGADILWVGLGKPKEQVFAVENQDRLSVGWIVTCGGCFNFVTGSYARAPEWMQRAGLEWLHRMATGPGYLIPRYLVTIPHAIWLVLWHASGGLLTRGRTKETS